MFVRAHINARVQKDTGTNTSALGFDTSHILPEVVVASSNGPVEVSVAHLDGIEQRVESVRERSIHSGDADIDRAPRKESWNTSH